MTRTRAIFLSLFIFFSASASFGQTSPYWGELKKGNFAAGFKTFEKKDFARATRPKTDFRGKLFEGERARPMIFQIWYPAVIEKTAMPMLYEDYSFVFAPSPPTEEQRKQFRMRFKTPRLAAGLAEIDLDKLLAMPTGAFYNATPVDQKFPLLIGANFSRSLAEYLASHGYVIALVSSNQAESSQINLVGNLEFGLNELQQHPNIDFSKIGATGFSFSGGTATLLQLKTNNIDAVISFDGIEAWTQARNDLANLPFFDPEAATVPYLRFHDSESAAANLDFALFYDRARFMNYTQIDYKDLGHRTAEAAILNHLIPNFDGVNPKNSLIHHRLMGEYTLNFLNAHLKKDEKAAAFLKRSPEENNFQKDFVIIRRKDALRRPPSQIESAELIDREGIESFLKINQELKTKLPKVFSSQMLTSLMLQFAGRNQPKNVSALAHLLVETYPELCTSYFNAAFNLQRIGDRETAIRYYDKFLEVEKTDAVTPSVAKDRMRQTATEALKNLKTKTT